MVLLEQWRTVVGYEGLYEVSNCGNIKNVRTGCILIQSNTTTGYKKVELYKNGRKSFKVHRLVAFAFIENPKNKPYINHKNGVKTDNRVENLEWCTQKENVEHALRSGLKKYAIEKTDEIIDLYINKNYPVKRIAKMYNVSITPIKRILRMNGIRIKPTGVARYEFNSMKER